MGDGFTRADLTAAALLSPMTMPPEHEFTYPPESMIPAPLLAFLDRMRDRPVFDWARRMYTDHRGRSAGDPA